MAIRFHKTSQVITGAVETVSVNNGNVGPVLVWHAPLVPGRCDIVIDANRNGVYDASTYGLDSGSPCFAVLASPPPTSPAPVPATMQQGMLLLIALLALASRCYEKKGVILFSSIFMPAI